MLNLVCLFVYLSPLPDNIATPIAAALGDLITLYILYTISDVLYRSQGKKI